MAVRNFSYITESLVWISYNESTFPEYVISEGLTLKELWVLWQILMRYCNINCTHLLSNQWFYQNILPSLAERAYVQIIQCQPKSWIHIGFFVLSITSSCEKTIFDICTSIPVNICQTKKTILMILIKTYSFYFFIIQYFRHTLYFSLFPATQPNIHSRRPLTLLSTDASRSYFFS